MVAAGWARAASWSSGSCSAGVWKKERRTAFCFFVQHIPSFYIQGAGAGGRAAQAAGPVRARRTIHYSCTAVPKVSTSVVARRSASWNHL